MGAFGRVYCGRISTQYHLFEIEYVLFINEADFTADDIAEDAGFSRKYGIEIRKDMRLAEMVELKNDNSYERLQSCYEEKKRLEDLVKRQSEKIKQMQNR